MQNATDAAPLHDQAGPMLPKPSSTRVAKSTGKGAATAAACSALHNRKKKNTSSAAGSTTSADAAVSEEAVEVVAMLEPETAAAAASAPSASTAAPAAKKQRTGRSSASKSAAAAQDSVSDSDDADAAEAAEEDDAEGGAAAAAAAADAASFSTQEVSQVNTKLLSWYDRVMRILPWRRNPHHKPDAAAPPAQQQPQQQDADAPASQQQQQQQPKKQSKKKPSKAEVAAAEAAAVVAAAKPAPADLSPQQFAYRVWVSEIMLQQTQVARVITYFNNWIDKWPTVQDLAGATQEQVNEVWAGLGYYRRARYLLEGAQYVVNKLDGAFPETAAGMRQIPGVGPYTAAAVASIAFNDSAAAVDGNVIRVIARLRALKGNPTKMTKTWDRLAAELLNPERPGCHNQAMMELGATVCKPVNPLCDACPVSACCAAYKQVREYAAAGGSPDVEDAPRVTDYPEKVAKAAKHEQHVAVCVLKVLTLPGVNTPQELAAAAAAAAAAGGSNAGGAAGKSSKGSSGSSKQGNIRAFFRPAPPPAQAAAAAAAAAGGDGSSKQQQLCEADVMGAGGSAHYLLVQRPASGLLAGLWEFPGVIVKSEPRTKTRRSAVDGYLCSTLGIQGLVNPTAAAAGGAKAGGSSAAAAAAAGVQVINRRQLGSAVHIFSHIRQTMHAEELVLLAPSLAAVCPAAAGDDADATGDGDSQGVKKGGTAAAAAADGGSSKSSSKKRKAAGKAADSEEDEQQEKEEGGGGGSSGVEPCMRWVSAAVISQQGLTSGVRKVLQLSLK